MKKWKKYPVLQKFPWIEINFEIFVKELSSRKKTYLTSTYILKL